MKLTRFHAIEEFYERVEAFLLQREAEHNRIIGTCAELKRYPERVSQQPYLAAAECDDKVSAAAFMLPPNQFALSRVENAEAIQLLALDLYKEHKSLPAVSGPLPECRTFAEAWRQLSSQQYELGMAQLLYQLEAVRPVEGVSGHMRRATEADRRLVVRWLSAFDEEAFNERPDPMRVERTAERFLNSDMAGLYLWEDREPVAMAGWGRPTPNGAVVQAVYTPPELRRRGYASACVAALSQMLLDSGRKYCFLYTDAANPTSNRIYQAIGYNQIGEAALYRFK